MRLEVDAKFYVEFADVEAMQVAAHEVMTERGTASGWDSHSLPFVDNVGQAIDYLMHNPDFAAAILIAHLLPTMGDHLPEGGRVASVGAVEVNHYQVP
jgi:hypothetical protein